MNIQDLLDFAIQALFWGLCIFTLLDFAIYTTIYWTGEFYFDESDKTISEPLTLESLKPDGIYNFGIALALSDPDT